MRKVKYLTLEQILYIHQDQIETFGGGQGVRDIRLLESAIERPKSSFSGEELYESISNKAVALMHSLIKNRPFIDGNKRTGVVAMLMFFSVNNKNIRVGQDELEKIVLQIANDEINIKEAAKWIEDNIQDA